MQNFHPPPSGHHDSKKETALPTAPGSSHVLVLCGHRNLNKRISLFIEGLLRESQGVRLVSLPRGTWTRSRFEQPVEPDQQSRTGLSWNKAEGSVLAAIFCFHWMMLPAALAMGLLRRVPVLYDEHDHYELNAHERDGWPVVNWFSSRAIRIVHALCLPFVRLVTCVHLASGLLKVHLQRWQSNVLELHNYPVSAWSQIPDSHLSARPLCFVYMGGVYVEKGVGAAAAAFCSLPELVRQNSELHVFGSGDQQLLRELGEKKNVILHDSLSPQELRDFAGSHRCCGLVLYQQHPRYCLIGTNSRKLYEYLAIGMPVICTAVGELKDFVERHAVGVIIDSEVREAEIASAMQKMLTPVRPQQSVDPWKQMAENARSLMQQREMTWEHEWEKLVATGILSPRGCRRDARATTLQNLNRSDVSCSRA